MRHRTRNLGGIAPYLDDIRFIVRDGFVIQVEKPAVVILKPTALSKLGGKRIRKLAGDGRRVEASAWHFACTVHLRHWRYAMVCCEYHQRITLTDAGVDKVHQLLQQLIGTD